MFKIGLTSRKKEKIQMYKSDKLKEYLQTRINYARTVLKACNPQRESRAIWESRLATLEDVLKFVEDNKSEGE